MARRDHREVQQQQEDLTSEGQCNSSQHRDKTATAAAPKLRECRPASDRQFTQCREQRKQQQQDLESKEVPTVLESSQEQQSSKKCSTAAAGFAPAHGHALSQQLLHSATAIHFRQG